MKESIYLLRANPALTTNIKLMCDSSYNLYLESYSANKELSDNKYKKVLISSDSFISERISNFYLDLPSNLAFEVKNTIKSDTIQKDINLQYDDLYYSGMRTVEDTRYSEEFQYNTTLKIVPNNLPKYFFIFRNDGAGSSENSTILDNKKLKVVTFFDLTKATNIGKLFQKNYIDDDVIPVSPFELNLKKFEFSKWNGYDYRTGGTVSKSMYLEDFFRNETTHYEMEKFITGQFQKNEVISSNYINVSFLYDDTVSGIFKKDTFYNIETDYKFMNEDIYNGNYKIGQDLTLSNNTFKCVEELSYRKRWTINRYHGFYIKDLHFLYKISPLLPVELNLDPSISVYKNEFIITGTSTTGIVPVNPLLMSWNSNKIYYIKIKQNYYLIEKNIEEIKDINGNIINTIDHYIIISDILFNDTTEDTLEKLVSNYDATIKIIWDYINQAPYIVYKNNIPFKFDYSTKIKIENTIFLLIKIYDKYYNVEYVDGDDNTRYCKIITDWYLSCDGYKFIRKYDSNKKEELFTQILSKDDVIPYFEFYTPEFIEIADWDFARDNTDYANIENDYYYKVNNTRPSLKEIDITDLSQPKDVISEQNYQILTIEKFNVIGTNLLPTNFEFIPQLNTTLPIVKYPNVLTSFILPMAGEYSSTGDLYILDKQNNISNIWDINQYNNKWGYLDSISHVSYPYKLNNNISVSGKNNFISNPYSERVDESETTLDWFYSFGIPTSDNIYSVQSANLFLAEFDIYFRSLNIDLTKQYQTSLDFLNPQAISFIDYIVFDLDYYKNSTSKLDIFNYFLNIPITINEYGDDTGYDFWYKKYLNRTSKFIKSDGFNGPSVFFKGFKAYIEYVTLQNPNLPILDKEKVEYSSASDLEGYEFAILFNNKETIDVTLHGKSGIEVIVNKIHKNVLIYIYVYTPFNCKTSLSFRNRDKCYAEDLVTYYDIELKKTFQTELKTSSLRLAVLYNILKDCNTTYGGFSAGITYFIVEERTQYNLMTNTSLNIFDLSECIYDASINGFIVTLTLSNYCPLKQGDWVHLKFNNGIYSPFTKNYKINSILNNTIKIELTDWASTFGIAPFAMNISELSYITKELSLIPFRLRPVFPDKVKINSNINILQSDTSSPVQPDNKLTNIQNILINDINKREDGTVENVWRSNPILRKIIKNNTEKELTYKEIDNLNDIYRYSGDYEPILTNINLFNKFKLKEYGINTLKIGSSFTPSKIIDLGLRFYKQLINGKHKLIIEVIAHKYNNLLNETNIFEIGDIFFVNFCSKPIVALGVNTYFFNDYNTYHKIANKFVQIDNIIGTYKLNQDQLIDLYNSNKLIEDLTIYNPLIDINIPEHLVYKLETNFELESTDTIYDETSGISNPLLPNVVSNLSINAYKQVNDKIAFDTTLKDFGVNKNIIIGKYTKDSQSPLKSSNPLLNENNKFAMTDEHGVTTIDRNIFKSNWDLEYYYYTLKNNYNQL